MAFAVDAGPRGDAAPWMRDVAMVRPLVPPAGAVAEAMLRVDPSLNADRTLQTWLPTAARTLDFAGRAGAFVSIGSRVLRGVSEDTGSGVPAQAGPVSSRMLRRPRPLALPENLGDEKDWRRPLAWYGKPGSSCIAFVGVWDTIPDLLAHASPALPDTCLFVGDPQPHGLVDAGQGMPPAWRGSVVVRCVLSDGKEDKKDAAQCLLGLLREANARGNLRCGLRLDGRLIPFVRIDLLGDDRLVFATAGQEQISAAHCTFECAFIPEQDKGGIDPVLIGAPTPPTTLEPITLRRLTLPLRGPLQGRFPLPVRRRTVFFADPAFDRSLSRVEPLSERAPGGAYRAWIDRPGTTPDELPVVRVSMPGAQDNAASFELTITIVYREGGTPARLLFCLQEGMAAQEMVRLEANIFYSLPISILRSPVGRLPQAGDVLVLKVTRAGDEGVRLLLPVKAYSSLPPPQAMYSLIATDRKGGSAWCSAHSACPAPDSMLSEVPDGGSDRLRRRARFKWVVFEPLRDTPLSWSIIRAERATESLHVPGIPEEEK